MAYKKCVDFPILTTERLTLRQVLETDVTEVFLLRSDKIINKYLDRQPGKTLEDALNFIKKINENIKNSDLKYWAVAQKENEKLIGTICLFGSPGEPEKCEIGYELSTDYQGQGIMREAAKEIIKYAFQALEINAIDASTHRDNQSSTTLLQKLNFEKIEIVDKANTDLVVFRLTKEVWQLGHSKKR